MSDATRILQRIEQGDEKASAELLPIVYEELRLLARSWLARERPDQTIQPTALVHEAWLRIAGSEEKKVWNSRGHFFGAAAEAMRRILIENARRKRRWRHGGHLQRVVLTGDAFDLPGAMPDDRLVEVDEALTQLESEAPQAAQVVKLRVFAGFTRDQAAEALGISPRTAQRYWAWAKLRLYRQIRARPE